MEVKKEVTAILNDEMIAKFMGYTTQPTGEGNMIVRPDGFAVDEYPKYHSSWCMLMQVVEKIETIQLPKPSMIPCSVVITGKTCSIDDGAWDGDKLVDVYDGNHGDKYTKFSATYEAVVRFIKRYNKNEFHG